MQAKAIEVSPETNFLRLMTQALSRGETVDYLICDEAQFYETDQIEQLARVVDDFGIDVFTFGITTDFRTELFPGAQRLLELADRVNILQVEALCWCGKKATHQARIVNGVMVTQGEQVVVGDVSKNMEISYEVLCRRHHMRRVTSRSSNSAQFDPLPFAQDSE